MKSSLAIYYALFLSTTLILAIPLSKLDASTSYPLQYEEEHAEHPDFTRRMLHVDTIASDFEPREKREPEPIVAPIPTVDNNNNNNNGAATNTSALDSPFASTHHMGHGPAVQLVPDSISTSSHAAVPLPPRSGSDSPTPKAVPNVNNTHCDNSNPGYQPVTPGGLKIQVYECDPSISAASLTEILLNARPQDNPLCKPMHANAPAVGTPAQNEANPAYIGGGEAAAPPGHYKPAPSSSTSTSAGGDTPMIEVTVKESGNATGTNTTTTITTTKMATNPPAENAGTGAACAGPANPNTANAPPSTKPRTPYALPPGFTGP